MLFARSLCLVRGLSCVLVIDCGVLVTSRRLEPWYPFLQESDLLQYSQTLGQEPSDAKSLDFLECSP